MKALILLSGFDHRHLSKLNIFRREAPSFQLWSLAIYQGGLLIYIEGDVGMQRAVVAPAVLRLYVLAEILPRRRICGDDILYVNRGMLRPSPVTRQRDHSFRVV